VAGTVGIILAVDYGRRRMGLAISDSLGIAGTGLPTLKPSGREDALRKITALASEKQVETILVGLPLNMDGTPGPMAVEAAEFAQALGDASGLSVVSWDERLTTESARKAMREMGSREKRGKKGQLDQMSAVMMLNDYLHLQAGRRDDPV